MKSSKYLLLGYLLGIATLQGLSFWFFPLPWSLVLMHSLPLVWGILMPKLSDSSTESHIFTIYLGLSPFLGPLATFACLLGMGVLSIQKKQALESYHNKVTAKPGLTHLEKVRFKLTRNLWSDKSERQTVPFVDIMKGTNTRLKQSVLDKVIQHPGPLSVKVLRQGLKDTSSEIRYYAASGLIQLNDYFQEQIHHLKDQAQSEDATPQDWYELGSAYDLYCYWELPASDVREQLLDQAEKAYQHCLHLDATHQEGRYALGRLWIRRKQVELAIQLLENAVENHPQSIQFRVWLAEALFENRRLLRLKELAQESVLQVELPDRLNEVFYYWAYDAAVQKGQHSQQNN